MAVLGKVVFIGQWIGAVVLPPALFFLQAVLGAGGGWGALFGAVLVIPMILVGLVPPLLTLFDRRVRASRTARPWYSVVTLLHWVFFLIAALTFSDAADGSPYPSLLSRWTGVPASASSMFLSVSIIAVVGLGFVMLGLAIEGVSVSRRMARVSPPTGTATE